MHSKWKTLVFDFDSTLINAEGLELLAETALRGRSDASEVLEKVMEITNLGMNGEITLEEALARRLAIMSINRTHIRETSELMTSFIQESVKSNTSYFTKHADSIYIVSGGFRDLILPVAKVLGIAEGHIFANEFIYDVQGAVVGVADLPTSKKFGKAATVLQLNAPHPIVMVGDGYTDYEVKEKGAADEFIAYTETAKREKIIALADSVVSDCNALVKLLDAVN